MLSEEYSQIWTAEAEADAADDVGSSHTVTTTGAPQQQESGPITSAIEGTQWTRDDIELAVSVLNGVFLVLTLYAVIADGEGI